MGLEGIRICMRGFPNRMLYPDFKMRYAILGAKEIASSDDNKTAVYALMDKINFSRDRYRLGHTLVFFRAGALAGLEEGRDEIVLKLVRFLQGEALRRIRGKVFQKRRDQRELIKVCQRQFRRYIQLRNWGWFVIIQKTRPLVGQPNPQEELRQLEEENIKIKEETAALNAELASKSGDMAIYQQRQAEALQRKAKAEADLVTMQQTLAREEAERIELQNEKKKMEAGVGIKKKEVEEVRMLLQKVENDKNSRDHTIKSLNDEIAEQDEIINRLNKEKKMAAEQ